MIRTSGAWARASSRRTVQNAYAYPRNPNNAPGNTTHFDLFAQRASPAHVVRRYNATKPPIGQKPPASATTIPGPSWLWLEPVIEPFRAYGRVQQRKPYVTQLVSSLVIYFVGDLVAQSIAAPEEETVAEEEEERGWVQQWSEDRDWARTGRALVIGGISSIPSYKWFLWLSMNFNYSSKILSLTTKVRCLPYTTDGN
jgi:protein Mpv17